MMALLLVAAILSLLMAAHDLRAAHRAVNVSERQSARRWALAWILFAGVAALARLRLK